VLVIRPKTASRNHTMSMWMVQDVLTPRMQHAHEADVSTQVLGISSDLQQCCCAGAE
jgi:hypothetical protein